jgi:hypothetical protein
MIDRYSVEKIIDGLWSEAVKSAAQDHLAAQAAGPRPKRRKLWWLVVKLIPRHMALQASHPRIVVVHNSLTHHGTGGTDAG